VRLIEQLRIRPDELEVSFRWPKQRQKQGFSFSKRLA
jgi:hypothetical protein